MNSTPVWPAEFSAAAALLLEAAVLAVSLQRSPWDFAVEISELRATGLSLSALRWLVCQNLLAPATEVRSSLSEHRVFRPPVGLTLDPQTCFILTVEGHAAALHLNGMRSAPHGNPARKAEKQAPATPHDSSAESNGVQLHVPQPTWHLDSRCLFVGEMLVKHFKVPAHNQELILNAFQEEQWIERIDDPLPPTSKIESRKRLRDAIAALNRGQLCRLLHFHGDGTGHGVHWRLLQYDAA